MQYVPKQKAHPWHGVFIGEKAPSIITTFIEIVPTDTVKYEIDKATGYLKIDRPQKFSNIVPALYGFIPQTYCGDLVAQFARDHSQKNISQGDGDPLDICVLTEQPIQHGDILLQSIPIGGIRLLDNGEADDKIIAVLKDDSIYGHWKSITDCPQSVIDRLKHYFLTYKMVPGDMNSVCEVNEVYSTDIAHQVIQLSRQDYQNSFV